MTGTSMNKKAVIPFSFLFILSLISCADLFQNGDLSLLAETSRGDITISDPLVTPSLFEKRVVTNLTLSVKSESSFEVVSVEADLTALGGGTVNLVKSGSTWSSMLYIQSENAGTLAVRFIARSKTGKIVEAKYNINVFTYGSVYVATNGNDNNTGLSISNAVKTIQKGVDIAEEKGIYEVWITGGVYDQILNDACLNMKSGLLIQGGFSLDFSSRDTVMTPTIIDGMGSVSHVVTAYSVKNTVLNGLSIRNGKAEGYLGYDGSGAGILLLNSDIRLINVVLSNNLSTNIGGGLFSYNSILTISNGMIVKNSSSKGGGLAFISCPSVIINSSLITNNTATGYGGGIFDNNSVINLSTNLFHDNISILGGGGAYFMSDSVTIDRCLFVKNRVTNSLQFDGGGGVEARESSFVITGSCFLSNMAMNMQNFETLGGGLGFNRCNGASVNNCLFEANTSTNLTISGYVGGGAIGAYYSTNTYIQNCWIQRNYGYAGGGVCNYDCRSMTMTGNYIYSNQTLDGQNLGSGVFGYAAQSFSLVMVDNILSYNYTPSYYGGAINLVGSSCYLNLQGGLITSNTNCGINTNGYTFTMSGVTFAGNDPSDFY